MKKEIEFKKDFRKKIDKKLEVSVIIVAYNTGKELINCLNSLKKQNNKYFEIILVDNGKENIKVMSKYNLYYIKLNKNYGPSLARNIGTEFARAKIVAFLDDDAIADKNWIKNILDSFNKLDIIGLRGKILPKTKNNPYNPIATHYNLGREVIPSKLDIEGNCALKKEILKSVGGFNPKLFGAEGLDLNYKLLLKEKDPKKIIYNPNVIIYHDFGDSFIHYVKKNFRHGKNNKSSKDKFKKLDYFFEKLHLNKKIFNKKLKLKSRIIKLVGTISYLIGYYS